MYVVIVGSQWLAYCIVSNLGKHWYYDIYLSLVKDYAKSSYLCYYKDIQWEKSHQCGEGCYLNTGHKFCK